jgi:hypothetical protein
MNLTVHRPPPSSPPPPSSQVRDLVRRVFGPDRFHYVYHINQADSGDRVLSVNSDNDVQVRRR